MECDGIVGVSDDEIENLCVLCDLCGCFPRENIE